MAPGPSRRAVAPFGLERPVGIISTSVSWRRPKPRIYKTTMHLALVSAFISALARASPSTTKHTAQGFIGAAIGHGCPGGYNADLVLREPVDDLADLVLIAKLIRRVALASGSRP